MPKRIVTLETIHQPLGAYSQAVEAVGSKTIYISGQAPVDPSGKSIGNRDWPAQIDQVLANLKAAVEGSGGTVRDICKITIFLTERVKGLEGALTLMREKLKTFFGPEYPASSLCFVSSLVSPDWLIEVEAVAVV